jgi:AcrR family transcriptional regulator
MPKVSPEYTRARRAKIVDVARELFARKGFSGTSMDDLAEATGLSIGALYRYFPSKERLVLAVVEDRDGSTAGGFDADEPATELLNRLIGYVRADTPASVTHAKLVTQIWADASVRPALAEVARARHSALRDHFATRIADGTDATTATDVAEFLLAAIVGYAALVATEHVFDADGFRHVADTVLRTLR